MKLAVFLSILAGNIFVFPAVTYALPNLDITVAGEPLPSPVFSVIGMMPGDTEEKTIDVANTGGTSRDISVVAERTDGDTEEPLIETILQLQVSLDGEILYSGTLADFFVVSATGFYLSALAPGQSASYDFVVTFPSSAGNEYQRKFVVFDLVFSDYRYSSLVINEVYYNVAEVHGMDCPKDRGVNATISGNGAGSVNVIDIKIGNTCAIVQRNVGKITNNINSSSNTGFNTVIGLAGSTSPVITGIASTISNIINGINVNVGSCGNIKKGQNHEWIEIYNPTGHDISLKDWRLVDNSGTETIIHANKIIKAGGFALLSKDSSVWHYWDESGEAEKIQLGHDIGDGLENSGDFLRLVDPLGLEHDFVAWGDNSGEAIPAIWQNLPQLLAPAGESIERSPTGHDTDVPGDWELRSPPTPGI